ncbi:hypothetical protein COI96_00070 [Priestia megaterium]|nr:hypothetical protein COI96_00070 [Priestia megaterium]
MCALFYMLMVVFITYPFYKLDERLEDVYVYTSKENIRGEFLHITLIEAKNDFILIQIYSIKTLKFPRLLLSLI